MAVVITGMHRSGTSMVAAALRAAGLDLGRDSELAGPGPDNLNGFFEHRDFVALDDDVLAACGGAWDLVPGLVDPDRLRALAPRGRSLVSRFDGATTWGWKDPRAALVLPFWLDLIPDLRIVVVVRNPLEVARSLAARNGTSVAHGVELWRRHLTRILETTDLDQRVVTTLDPWFGGDDEGDRVADAIGLTPRPGGRAPLRPMSSLRHQRCSRAELVAEVPRPVIDLYDVLVNEARRAREPQPVAIPPLLRAVEIVNDEGATAFPPTSCEARGDLAHTVQLEVARRAGARHLVVPGSARDWLDRHPRFAADLTRRFRRDDDLAADEVRFDLRAEPAEPIRSLVTALTGGSDSLTVLDRVGLPIESIVPHAVVVRPTGVDRLHPAASFTVVCDPWDRPDGGEASRARVTVDGERIHVAWCALGRERPAAGRPGVSVVIPCYDDPTLTEQCLASLLELQPVDVELEIIAVDDCSRDGTGERLDDIARREPRLTVLHNPVNLGFVRSCNRGAAAARHDVLVLLNNDTLVLPGWIEPLLDALEDTTIGVVGGRLVYPDGRLQEAGGLIFANGNGANFGRHHLRPDADLFQHRRDVDYVSGALLATPRAVWEELGGFDERYCPAYYEDTDYCFRVTESGRRVVCEPASTIVHLEGASNGTDLDHGVKHHQVVNRERFVERWAPRLAHLPDPPARYDEFVWHRLALRPRPVHA